MACTFVVEQKKLLSILHTMQPICSKRTTLDATSSILFHVGHKELIMKATDLEISLQAQCMISDVHVAEPLSFLVAGRRIFDLVKELDGEISCTLKNNQLLLKSSGADLMLNIKNAEDFPPFPERIENLLHIDGDFLLELLDKVGFLIPQNNANPSLNGLLLEIDQRDLTMTTTDGHCLAQVRSTNYALDEKKRWLLPRRAVIEIKKIIEGMVEKPSIFLGICGNQLVFSGEYFNFFTKVLNDQFPEYQTILNKDGFIPAKIDRERFIKTLRRSVCFLSGQFLATKFDFNKDSLSVSMENKDVGMFNEQLPLNAFDTDGFDIRFYAPYLLNGLQSFDEQELSCYLKTAQQPAIFQLAKNNYELTYLVMPVSPTTGV